MDIETRVYYVDLGERIAVVDLFGPLGSRLVAAADARDDARQAEEEFARQRRLFAESATDSYLNLDAQVASERDPARPTWEQRRTYEEVFPRD